MTKRLKRNLLCKLFGHKFKSDFTIENKPCDKWDDCNIPEHRFNLLTWNCQRCNSIQQERVYV